MLPSSLIVLNTFLKNYPAKEQVVLLEPLSQKTKEQLEKSYCPPIAFDPKKFNYPSLLDQIHYSWYLSFLSSFTLKDLSFFLEVFKGENKELLQKHFKIADLKKNPSPLVLDFCKQSLWQKITEEEKELLPKEYLPDSELNLLLELSKKEITELIDYLALYDLALQIPKIVDPKILKKIDAYISQEQKLFLKTKTNYKENFSFPKMDLKRALNSFEDFHSLLHKRGLNRFAKVLCNEHQSLIWYICHYLDVGRGQTLLRFCQTENAPLEVIKSITFNILELLPIIRTKV